MSAASDNTAVAPDNAFFLLTPDQLQERFNTNVQLGLPAAAIAALQARDGPNELNGGGGVSILAILAGQIFNAMVLILIMAFAVSLGIQSWIESGVIAAVIIANIGVGFFQEYGSAKTMDSLRNLASPNAHVIRDGQVVVIPSSQVVVGDLVELKTGDVVPADLRLVEAMNFEADEALLTGESLPSAKDAGATWDTKGGEGTWDSRDVGVGDRINMAFTSSTVTKGRAKGIVVSIGMGTEIGAIAESLRSTGRKARVARKNEDGSVPFYRHITAAGMTALDALGAFLGTNVGTPLHRKLSWLAILLFFVAVLFAIIVFAANKFQTDPEIVLYAVATGLSMIPASLVVVLTITLAGGTRAMVARNVIVRKLDSLEALGGITDICSDKTGTLTQGKMVTRAAWIPALGTILVGETNEPFNPTIGELTHTSMSPAEHKAQLADIKNASFPPPAVTTAADMIEKSDEFHSLLNVASLCNLATVVNTEGVYSARGDPTECAIQVFAHRFNWGREVLAEGDSPKWTQRAEYPFDSDVKRMSVIFARNSDEKEFVFMKGAVERIIEACQNVQTAEGLAPLDEAMEADILTHVEALAEQGLRVLGLAQKSWVSSEEGGEAKRKDVEANMTLVGLVGLYDPPRPETQGAVRRCHNAGIQVHMLTGDHAATARAIALEVGIVPRSINTLSAEVIDAMVITAAKFDKMTEEAIDAMPMLPLVIARCSPTTKVRMVDALHRRGAFCAMTGDGVNDSPALKRADVGIAMGLAGSDVAKDASDIVLTDDNFASILNAVEEGRRMFDNIKKFVLHLLAENITQAITLLVGLAFKDVNDLSVFPLAPVEILWIIMITSGFPAMGLGGCTAADNIMRRPPHDLNVGVFTWEVVIDMAVYGTFGAALCLASFSLVVFGFNDGNLGIDSNDSIGNGSINVFRARSTTFAMLTWLALILAFEMMDMRRSFFRMKPKTLHPWTQWARDVWSNRFLFWSVLGGWVSVFPLIYIPVINDVVFKHAPISWEWGIVFIGSFLFVLLVEAWKFAKRVYYRRQTVTVDPNDPDGTMRPIFAEWRTMSQQTKGLGGTDATQV